MPAAALTVERWHHKAFLGRDVFVEIVYKGFIFPLGHRCAVIKSTERKFLADPNDRSGKAPVAYLIQRYFVVVGEPKKPFPAIGERFGGLALHASAITMLTTKSPDIVPPFENDLYKDVNGNKFGSAGGIAFFPKTQPGHGLEGAVKFEYQTEYADGTVRKLKGPLIVVDNTLAHDPEGIGELVAYYNTLPEAMQAGRTAEAAGQRFRYAEEKSSGSTEFVTQSWLLGATGRQVDPNSTALFEYTMDAVMEGADQPPFYPVCAVAQIEVQSLNYMNGKSQGYVPAAYDLNYLLHGFSVAKNPSGIFLALLEQNGKRTELSVDDNTAASGGLATPNMKAVAISREKGPVGGTKTPKNLSSSLDNSVKATITSNSDLDLSVAQQGQFDPLEALVGALKLPKLFGIIPLQSLIPILSFIDGAPEAIESTTYKITDDIAEFAAEAGRVAAQITGALDKATGEIDRNLAAFSVSLGVAQPIQLKDLYPRLAGAFNQLRGTLTRLEESAARFDPANPNGLSQPCATQLLQSR